MRHFGLIGKKLGHSWSADYFTRKFAEEHIDADYRLIELDDLADLTQTLCCLSGYNVTIPYKTAIIPYLQELDQTAREIGAVNVVKGGKGYNTDWLGFRLSLEEVCGTLQGKALIVGKGGAAKAIQYALREMGMTVETVSARGKITEDVGGYDLIVNATPLGMWPDVTSFPDLDYTALHEGQVLFDCVYNPTETEFLRRGKAQGATTINGKRMLEIQAEESWKIFNS